VRMHEGTQTALLKAMELLKDVAMGHAPMASSPSVAAPAPMAATAPLTSQTRFQGAAASDGRCRCRAPVEAYQHWCIKCGAEQSERNPPAPRPLVPPQGSKCPACKEINPSGANYCWCCRHAFAA